jgi:hypothetical protein
MKRLNRVANSRLCTDKCNIQHIINSRTYSYGASFVNLNILETCNIELFVAQWLLYKPSVVTFTALNFVHTVYLGVFLLTLTAISDYISQHN